MKRLRAAARVYSGWGFSQAFYRDEIDREVWRSRRLQADLLFSSLEDLLVAYWEEYFPGVRGSRVPRSGYRVRGTVAE